MNADTRGLKHKELTETIIGVFFEFQFGFEGKRLETLSLTFLLTAQSYWN